MQSADSDAHALGGAKEARWHRVLCMLILAAADARRFCANVCNWGHALCSSASSDEDRTLTVARAHVSVVRLSRSHTLPWTCASSRAVPDAPDGGSETFRYFFSDPGFLRLQKVGRAIRKAKGLAVTRQ